MEIEELGESELGTKEYWENRYEQEIKSYKTHGDPGEIWFGEDIVDRILKWFKKNESKLPKNCKIIDVGCGNGMLLVELAAEGFTNLHGVDYSEKAIELAKAVAEKHKITVNYSTGNILETLSGEYFVIHDKGTYDAISLSTEATQNRNKYIENIFTALDNDGFFIITSCNWTLPELDNQFANKFVRVEEIPTPQFKFGGKIGSVVTCAIYKKQQ